MTRLSTKTAAVITGLVLIALLGTACWHYFLNLPHTATHTDGSTPTAISVALQEHIDDTPTRPQQPFDWQAEDAIHAPELSPNGYLARIQLNSPKELEHALLRAEKLYLDGKVSDRIEPPAFVLHGPEVTVFFKENYEAHKSIVDLAARLSALNVVDVRVCRTRMGILGREEDALFPFVGTVPYGPAEITRLLNKQNYVYF